MLGPKRAAALAVAVLVLAAACAAPSASTPTSTPSPTSSPISDPTPSSGAGPADSATPTPASTGTPEDVGPLVPAVAPDPGYEQELDLSRVSTFGWETDFSRHTVPFREISSIIRRDGIPPIDKPAFTTIDEANTWLADVEPVIALDINGQARAYPLQIMTFHEIVNDVVGGVPVAATFCPLCNSAIVFDRRLGDRRFTFGVSGNLRNSDLIMWDRQTQTWWQQFTGEAIVGELAGNQLTYIPATITSWADFKAAFPEGDVLSNDTGFDRPYGLNPYAGYDRADNPPFLFDGDLDGRLLPKDHVVAVTVGGTDVAFPFRVLEVERVVNYGSGGQDVVVFFKPGTTSALGNSIIVNSEDIGSTGVFDPRVDGRKLTFSLNGDRIVDNETGSEWNVLGQAVNGELQGSRLTEVLHGDHFWFAWAAFKPDTIIYQSD
jgi:hypothetical protein